jgi:hypothetical protein
MTEDREWEEASPGRHSLLTEILGNHSGVQRPKRNLSHQNKGDVG